MTMPHVAPRLRPMTASPLAIVVAAQMVNVAIRFATADLPHVAKPRGMQVAFKLAWICAETLFTVAQIQVALLATTALEVPS